MNRHDLKHFNINPANRKDLKSFAYEYGLNPKWYNLTSTIRTSLKIAVIGWIYTIDDIDKCFSVMGVKDYEIIQGPIGDRPGVTIVKFNTKFYQFIEKCKMRKAIAVIKKCSSTGIIVNLEYRYGINK